MSEALQGDGAAQALAAVAMDAADRAELAAALARLERGRGVIVRLADLLGGALDMASRFGLRQIGISRSVQGKFSGVARAALARAYDVAILGLGRAPARDLAARASLTRAAVIASGAASGFTGLAGFLPDATFTTLSIMREIARIAVAEGEDLSSEEARRACLEVFAFRSAADEDESELGYFSARLVFQGRPFTLLISEVAARYGVVLGEKFSLQMVPIAGALAGAALNAAFLDHYRNLALAHFTIRRLERRHGRDCRARRLLAADEPHAGHAVHRCMSESLEDDDLPALAAHAQDAQPGSEAEMEPRPRSEMERYRPSGRLAGRVALISGGDSGIGRAVAVGFAKEGADVAITWLNEHEDAARTVRLIEAEGQRALSIPGDIGNADFAPHLVRQVVAEFGRIDILVNNAAEQHLCENFEEIEEDQVERTFRTNILGMFWLTKAALPHMAEGASIINTTSVTAYKGSATQVDYAATKGAIVAFTRSLALQLVGRGIRVNAVAPGPVWTKLIPASYPAEKTAHHGESVAMQRPAQPDEIAPSYIFLASSDAATMTGQVLHPNGGTVING